MKAAKKWAPYRSVKLVGPRVTVRPYKFSDFKGCMASHEARLPLVSRFDQPVHAAQERTFEKFKARVARQRELGKARHNFIFGIFDSRTEDFLGQVDVMVIHKDLRWGNLGYHIQNQFGGKGYATEAARLAVAAAFKILGFHRVEAAMELDNLASRKVARNAGLEFEGVRKKFFPAEGGGIDMEVYASNAFDFKTPDLA